MHCFSNMRLLILHNGRTPWSAVRTLITRCCQFKRDAAVTTETPEPSDEINGNDAANARITRTPPSPDIHVTPTTKRDTPCCSDTEIIVNQLAILAASVSQSSASTAPRSQGSSTPSLVTTATTQYSATNCAKEDHFAEEESFHYLQSLITISCLSQHTSSQLSVSSTTQEVEPSSLGRKRATSRLSIRLGDLSGLSFPTKLSRKPCPSPRYTTLPPIYSPKHITTRPEVRF